MNGRKWIVRGLAGAALAWMAGRTALTHAQQPAPAAPASATAAATKPAAVVNGEPISMLELETVIKQAPSPVELPEEARKIMRRQALTMLIDDTLMQQFIRANTAEVAKTEIDQKMAEMEATLKKENKTVEWFCKENGQTVEQLRDGVMWMLRWDSWANKNIADTDVQRYYEAYKDYFDGTTVHVKHIALRLQETSTEAERAKAKAQLADLRAQLQAGKLEFSAAAKSFSQCESNKNGGDLGFLTRKMVDETFARTAFSLQPGQLSDVVETGFGVHLITVTERKPGPGSEFAKMKDQVREIYTEEVRQAQLAAMRKKAKIEVNIP